MTRRVVTGINAEGKSCVIIDGPLQQLSGQGTDLVWRTEGLPADNSGTGDCPGGPMSLDMLQGPGSVFIVTEYAPGQQAFWHATDTIDYIIMLEGEVVLELESGSVRLKAGDVLVDRGVVHNWRNDTDKPARAAVVLVPAHPVGKGRTV